MALVTGYGAMAERLWTTLPTVQFSHTVISTLVVVKILFKCPTANFRVLCAWLYGPAQQWLQWLMRMLCYTGINIWVSFRQLYPYLSSFLHSVLYWAEWMDWCIGQWTARVGVVVLLQYHQERGNAWSLGCGLIMFALYAAILTWRATTHFLIPQVTSDCICN